MKASNEESERFDKALDEILDLFNNLESDEPIINLSEDVLGYIEKAKKKYGTEIVEEKVNTVLREMLSWLDFEEEDTEES